MWIVLAFLSALFAGISAVLAKCGIKNTDFSFATALRTGVVLIMAFITVLVTGNIYAFRALDFKSVLFLALSGIATGASWLCYFKAIQQGDVSVVAPIDKSSAVLTVLLCFFVLGENPTPIKWVSLVFIAAGTLLMSVKKSSGGGENKTYIVYAALSAVFASLTAILAKIGVNNVESNTATFLRTGVVLAMAWAVVLITKKQGEIKKITKKDMLFICLSGIATGASWLCYYRALQQGQTAVVVSIDKLSIIITVLFSATVLKEKVKIKEITGLVLIVAGTFGMMA